MTLDVFSLHSPFLSLAKDPSAWLSVCACVCVCFGDQRLRGERGFVPWGRAVTLTNLTFELCSSVATSHFSFSKLKHTHTTPTHTMPQRWKGVYAAVFCRLPLFSVGWRWGMEVQSAGHSLLFHSLNLQHTFSTCWHVLCHLWNAEYEHTERLFVSSRFPVILSIENHCSIQQQKKIAQYLREIFGDKLDVGDALSRESKTLPSPHSLRGKILIKVRTNRWLDAYV